MCTSSGGQRSSLRKPAGRNPTRRQITEQPFARGGACSVNLSAKCAGYLCVATSEHGFIGSAIAPRYRSGVNLDAGVVERLASDPFQLLTVSCPNRNAMLTSSGTDLTFILRIILPR